MITRDFSGSAIQLSLVTSAQGIGLIAGGFFMTAWGGFRRRLFTSALGWAGVGIAYVIIAVTPGSAFDVLLVVMFCLGFVVPIGCAPLDAFYQSCVAPDKQGRVFAVLGSIDGATVPLGLILAGVLGDAIPLRAWWMLVGVSHAALAVAWIFMPSIKRAEEEHADLSRTAIAPAPDLIPQ